MYTSGYQLERFNLKNPFNKEKHDNLSNSRHNLYNNNLANKRQWKLLKFLLKKIKELKIIPQCSKDTIYS